MEEAEAVADQIGILARRMLVTGTPKDICSKFGDLLQVNIVANPAPDLTDGGGQRIIEWIRSTLPEAHVEANAPGGRFRVSIRRENVPISPPGCISAEKEVVCEKRQGAIGRLVLLLEDNMAHLGIRHISIIPTTLDQAFLRIVGNHEEIEDLDADAAPRSCFSLARWMPTWVAPRGKR
ncbi:hypothetical protein JDV02_004305 [Purpureocillium takamizusanense]|uniref:Uncharacterized protein n=1 Tax=Purpureocillium takamizusanense TaxID=2060973 RepID=A0A9Q8VAM0_9HYPO|nr:uncharacterized protein JDV02_004305 [Purpureocillium takamizusanense]UNI18004.1 hypothetical protein JDV02_004305 [Purpureocillium takamizusanense]